MKISDIDTFRTDINAEPDDVPVLTLNLTAAERDYLKAVLEEKRKTFKTALRHNDLKPSTRTRNRIVLNTILGIEDKIRQ